MTVLFSFDAGLYIQKWIVRDIEEVDHLGAILGETLGYMTDYVSVWVID